MRIGRPGEDKVRPIRIKLKLNESRGEILKRAKNLKDTVTFKNVYITPDVSRKQ